MEGGNVILSNLGKTMEKFRYDSIRVEIDLPDELKVQK